MRTTRKLVIILMISFVCCFGAFAYDQAFENSVVEGEWIGPASIDNFGSLAENSQAWLDFAEKCLDKKPAKLTKVELSTIEGTIKNLQEYIEASTFVEDNDVYAYVISKSTDADTGIVSEGWLILSHYSKKANSWTFYAYSFKV